MRIPQTRTVALLFAGAMSILAIALLVGPARSAGAHAPLAGQAHGESAQRNVPIATPTADAYAYWVYNSTAPTEITITLNAPVPLDLYINSGSNTDLDGQQSYLTYTYGIFQFVNASEPTCVPTSTVQIDNTVFDVTLQNEICNGPGECTFRSVTVPAGSFAFSSGALSNCPQGCGGVFRVAHTAICGTSVGQGLLHWQFSPPAPVTRDSEIINIDSEQVQNPALYTDLIVNVVDCPACPTDTPAPTYTPAPTNTPTPSSSSTPSQTFTPGPTYTPTRTHTATPTEPVGSATPCAMGFTDVYITDYFYYAVRYLYCEGAISGYADGSFRPYNNTTRGQLSKIVTLAEGWPIDTTGGPHFSDVRPGSAFYEYVETAYHHQVISGYSDGTFQPGNNVTRGQLSKIVVLAQTWQPICAQEPTFSDVPASNPFYCYVEAAYCHGIISGYADGTFRWGNYATRGQISKIVFEARAGGHGCGAAAGTP